MILADIFLDSQTVRIADVDLYIADGDYITDDQGNYILDDAGNYLVSSGSGELFYKRALMNAPSITRQLPDDSSGIVSERSITLQIADSQDTQDDTWIDIIDAEEIRGKEVKIFRYDDGMLVFSCWGIIQQYSYTDFMELTVSIFDNGSLEVNLPKHTITSDRFTDSALDAGQPVNIPFGHCVDVPLYNIQNYKPTASTATGTSANKLIDSTASFTDDDIGRFVHRLEAGVITDIALITARDSSTQLTLDSDIIVSGDSYGIRCFDYLVGYGPVEGVWEDSGNNRGVHREDSLVTTSEYTLYDGSQISPFPGYAFIRFAVEQKDYTGNYFTLTADIQGLKLGGSSAERNFANIIYHLLTNETWGLGQSANAAAFEDAADYLSTDWLCDGAITSSREAGDILDDLLFCCCGILDRNMYAEWMLAIAQPGSSVATYGCNDGHYNNAETLRKYSSAAGDVPKGITVKYGHEPGTSEYAYELSGTGFSSFGIDVEHTLPFVEDSGTAKRKYSHIRNLPVWSSRWVDAKFSLEFKDRKKSEIITYIDPRRNINGDFIIWELTTNNRDDYQATLRNYSANIFSQETLSTPTTLVIGGDENDLNAWTGDITVGNSNGDAASVLIKAGGSVVTDENPSSNGGVYINHEGIIIYRDDGSIFLKADVPSGLFNLDGEAIIGSAWIQTAMIDNLQVSSAKIANLTVGTGKITDGAITAPYYAYTNTDWVAGVGSVPAGCTSDNIILSQEIEITQDMLDATSSGEVNILAIANLMEKTRDDCQTLAGFKLYSGATLTDPNVHTVFYRSNDSDAKFYFLSGYTGADVLVFRHTVPMMGSVAVDTAGTYTVTVEWCGDAGSAALQAALTVWIIKK